MFIPKTMKNLTTILLSTLLLFTFVACNDLSSNVHSEIVEENFYETEQQVLSAAGPAYSGLRPLTQPEGFWGIQEFTSDEMVLPTRGNDWYNDGMYQRYQRHEWHTEEGHVNISWGTIFGGINTANRLLYQFENIEDKSEAVNLIINELKGLRAYWYFLALDTFGNVPIVTSFEDAEATPANNSRQEVFNFVESELLEVIPELREEKSSSTYGRFHRWAAYSTLAKLYMNADVYVGEPRYGDALDALNAIIDSGNYNLANDFFANFAVENQDSPENIFVIPYDANYVQEWGSMFQFHFWTLYFNGNEAFDMQLGGWNGFAGDPAFVQSYDEDDTRSEVWLTGIQYTPSGDTIYEGPGVPLEYTVEISSLESAADNAGARFAKYDFTGARNNSMSNDYVIYRYADILLMKAEALMRQNGGAATQEAVTLVNDVRERAFANPADHQYTTSSLTLDTLLDERGWELVGEGWRRNDLIRFGEFTSGSWTFKSPSEEYRQLFPIPQQQRNSNPNLTQNPGYN